MAHYHPRYSLSEIKRLVGKGARAITISAQPGIGKLGFSEEDVWECVLQLERGRDFDKSIRGDKYGQDQDVYKTTHLGENVYLKLKIGHTHDVVVISFKPDESAPPTPDSGRQR